jgi:hypothetical protein
MRVEQMLIWQEKPRIRFVKKLTSTSLSPFFKTNFKEQERDDGRPGTSVGSGRH